MTDNQTVEILSQLDPFKIRAQLFKERNFEFIYRRLDDGEIKENPKQKEALEILTSGQEVEFMFGGAAGPGKSWVGCSWILFMCYNYPGTRWFIARNRLSDILESVLVTFKKVCNEYGFEDYKFNGQKYYIEFGNGSYINFVEISYKPSDPEFEGVGSTEYTGGWIEEVGQVHAKGAAAMYTRAGRHMNEEYGLEKVIFYTCNPSNGWPKTQFYDKWTKGELEKGRRFLPALVTDNPFIPKSYANSLLKLKDTQPSMYKRLYLGDWDYIDNPYQLTEDDMVDAVFENNHVSGGKKYITADVARFGSDKARIGYWDGWILKHCISLDISKTTDVELAIRTLRFKYKIPRTRVLVDADGVGGGVADGAGARSFNNNARPIKKGGKTENYRNLQVQCLYYLADIINDAKMWIEADLTEDEKREIKEEFKQIQSKGDQDPTRKLDCKSKGDIKSDIGRSPDWRDMIMMRSWFDLKGTKRRTMSSSPRETI